MKTDPRPLGKPYKGAHWDTQESHTTMELGPETYGVSEKLYKNPESIRDAVPYPYRGATGAAMREVFIGEPCCRSWGIGEKSGRPWPACAMYTANGVVGANTCGVTIMRNDSVAKRC